MVANSIPVNFIKIKIYSANLKLITYEYFLILFDCRPEFNISLIDERIPCSIRFIYFEEK